VGASAPSCEHPVIIGDFDQHLAVNAQIRKNNFMKLEVLLFASFADAAGARTVTLEIAEPCSVGKIVEALRARFPALKSYDLRKLMVAVNQEIATEDRVISAGDEVGVFPPVSGG
jgi:molybdopterin converting factor subunit 1